MGIDRVHFIHWRFACVGVRTWGTSHVALLSSPAARGPGFKNPNKQGKTISTYTGELGKETLFIVADSKKWQLNRLLMA